jgi:hypothetical protein
MSEVHKYGLEILIGAKIERIEQHIGWSNKTYIYFSDIPHFKVAGKTLRLMITDNEGYGADFNIEEINKVIFI